MNLKNGLKFFYSIIKIIFIIFFTYNCSSLPGISKNPKKQKGSKINLESYTISNVKIDIIKINKLNEDQIKKYNNLQIKELKYSIEKFPNIYNEELNDLCERLAKIKDNKLYFVRTDKTSLKNGCFGIGPYNNMKQIIMSICSTKFGHHAFDENSKTLNLYLIEYVKINMDKEFRVFVVNNTITCISQQNIYKKNIYFENKDKDEINIFIKKLIEYFNNYIKDKLLDFENYIMDICYLDDINDFYFIEINPFGSLYSSGSACFHWINDNDTIMDTSCVEFRYVI